MATTLKCETCLKDLGTEVQRFCGEDCRGRFVEGLRKGTVRHYRPYGCAEASPPRALTGPFRHELRL